MNIATHFRFSVILLLFSGLAACSITSTHLKSHQIPGLEPILKAYRETVRLAHADKSTAWNHGRLGNILVNLDTKTQRGLCFHWQKRVYISIQPALINSDWTATGIAINEGSFFEHHAVLVYNHTKIRLDNILKHQHKSLNYVLDPWSSGEPRVYLLTDWLQLPHAILTPPRLTVIDTRPTYPASQ